MSQPNVLILHLILLTSAFIRTANGYYYYIADQCLYNSRDLSDMVYVQLYAFNMAVEIKYSSTSGKFIGFNDVGVNTSKLWNQNADFLQQMKAQVETFSKPNAQFLETVICNKTVQPKVKLSSVIQAQDKHPSVLMWSVYDYYPERIKVCWLRDGKPVTSTMEMADGDWYFQIHSQLDYAPKSGEKISCVVEHSSFNKPMIYDWDPPIFKSERNKIVIGASGLVLGIIIAPAGVIYYKKKSAGRILVPHNPVQYDN